MTRSNGEAKTNLRLHRPGAPPPVPKAAIAPDCRLYRGDRPCLHNRLCNGCTHYDPWSHRLCIIKLGALGDVIRTLCLLPELRRLYPAAQITWVSKPAGCRMIANHPMIDRVLVFDNLNVLELTHESFDLLINLDKEPESCALANALFAKHKMGMGLSSHGTPVPVNVEAHQYFHLGLCDELKFRQNAKSYPQLIYEALGLVYRGQRYELPVDETLSDRVRLFLAARSWRPGAPTLGINVGAGHTFAHKMWSAEQTLEFVRQIRREAGDLQIILLGGPDEQAGIERILEALRSTTGDGGVIDGGTEHDEQTFVALVDACDVVLTGDTMAMHVALARHKPVVALFGSTCAQEIDLFGQGAKLPARVVCSPCYKRDCDQNGACMKDLTTEEVVRAVSRALTESRSQPRGLTANEKRKAG